MKRVAVITPLFGSGSARQTVIQFDRLRQQLGCLPLLIISLYVATAGDWAFLVLLLLLNTLFFAENLCGQRVVHFAFTNPFIDLQFNLSVMQWL